MKLHKINFKAFIVSSFGTALECYDFALFGFLVPVFAPFFFPSDNALLSTIYGYLTFAVGYL